MEEQKPSGAGWINALLVRRTDERGDLVGSIALWAFVALLVCLVLGGSSLVIGGLTLTIPVLDIGALVSLLAPVVLHTIKRGVEERGQ